jgi:heavy metal sensor kinase
MHNTIRLRLTLWYLSILGILLVAFSLYVYSLLSSDLHTEFDTSLLRTAMATTNYFNEFVERKNEAAGALETVKELQFEELRTAIYREGVLLAASGDDIPRIIQGCGILSADGTGNRPTFATDTRRGLRMVAAGFREENRRYVVVVLAPLSELTGQLARMRRIFFIALPAALLLAAAGGSLLAKKSLEPVVRISDQTQRIGASNLDQRLTIPNPGDELGRLGAVINALLSRLEASFKVMREFMADASHELRTPIAVIHAEADVTLSRERSLEDYRNSLQVIRNQSGRLKRIVSDMLILARADAGQQPLHREEIYLDDLVDECCRAAQSLAAPAGVQLSLDTDRDIGFQGDEELLRRMTVNLLDNAIHYTRPGGSVAVELKAVNSHVRLTVSDTGVGIPTACQARVFDRFYRVDNGSRKDGGVGLGLAIVKLAAEAHRGSVALESEPGQGSTFTVDLPLR